MIGKKIEALKAATDSNYRLLMLLLMLLELGLLAWLVALEALHR
jgi:hypothetical protein